MNPNDTISQSMSVNLRPQMQVFPQKEEEKPEPKDELESIVTDLENRSNYDVLAGSIQKEFYVFKGAKLIQEQIAIRAHQNCKGVYPAEMQFDGTSRAFVCATRPKVQTMVGVIMPIINPPGSNSWTVSPDGDMIDKNLIRDLISQGADEDVIVQQLKNKADARCDAMTSKIVTGLSDTEYPTKLIDVVWDSAMYGTGFMAAPLAVSTGREPDELGLVDEWRPDLEPIPFFEAYPDPGAKRREDMVAFIRRRVINRSQMRKLLKDESFNKEAVEDILTAFPNGNWSPEWWEAIINIVNSQPQLSAPNGRYIVLQKWGYISGKELYDMGFTDIDEDQWQEEVLCNVWVCGHRVIKLKVSQLYKSALPIYIVPWSKNPYSLYGVGIPEMMFDSQDAINACERAKMDNLAMSNAPIGEVNESRLAPGQDALQIVPRLLIRSIESEISPNTAPAVRWQLIPNNVQLIQAVQDRAFAWADEQTSVPRFLAGGGGEGVHNRTLGGASLQFNNSMNPTKAIVFNFENCLIIPMIEDMVRFFKEYSKDPRINGEFKVDTKSIQGIMSREAIMQQLGAFLQIMSQQPEMAKRLDYDRIGDVITRYMGLVDAAILLPDTVVQQREQATADQQMQREATAQKIKAETSPKDALIELANLAPEDSHTRMALLAQATQAWGFLDEAVEAALEADEAQFHLSNQAKTSELEAKMDPNNGAPAGVLPVAPKPVQPLVPRGPK